MIAIIILVVIPAISFAGRAFCKRIYNDKEYYQQKCGWFWDKVLVKIVDYYFVVSEQKLFSRLLTAFLVVFGGIPIGGKVYIHTTHFSAYLSFDGCDVYSLVAFGLLCITFVVMLLSKKKNISQAMSVTSISANISATTSGSNNILSNQINQNVGTVNNYYIVDKQEAEFVLPNNFDDVIALSPLKIDEIDAFLYESDGIKPKEATSTTLRELVKISQTFFVSPRDPYEFKNFLRDNLSDLDQSEVNDLINKLVGINYLSRTNCVDAYGCNVVTYGPGSMFDDFLRVVQ